MKRRLTKILGQATFANILASEPPTHTRKINPKLGLLGILGFLGFLGFLPNFLGETYKGFSSFYIFFAFFGFFGAYYEGIMSNTLIDERFKADALLASAIANRIGLLIIVIIAFLSLNFFKFIDKNNRQNLLIATIAFSFGLSCFLRHYLLYKFDGED